MAVRFDADFNKEIRRTVYNFNRRRNRAYERGVRNLPPTTSVREMKQRYTTRKMLKKQLQLLQDFSNKNALGTIELSGGAKSINWNYNFLKANLRQAKNFYDREIKIASKNLNKYSISGADILNNYKVKRQFLNKNLDELNREEFRTFQATITEFLNSERQNLLGFKNYLGEIELIMRRLGYDNSTINKVVKGFDVKLTPRQFIEMYRRESLVERIYELYIPSKDKDNFELNLPDEEARDLIDDFIELQDTYIEKYNKM